ncbi:TIGR02680 family protein [Streptomyces adelaidensis]|uniref:TIGR02680 family protein n=1 Tax=Streptomyces adelaidensis TaxID=2796465 RepID=UPI0019044E0A|nr:TIGR02680 family protein [Streptomyces adelaidensis]
MTALPAPARARWQPLRIGLVDLFYYDVEEFWFRDGRLLLRGNNGTGKSKVLALTLPFLLDGDLSAHRVEPDGDAKKRMEWNLLLGGEHPHPERLGYTWIEFGRRDASGRSHFRTLACGLKAVEGRGIARHWYAVTDQRVGENLSLLDATGAALSRDRLAEAVAGHGMVYDQAKVYRRAVDEALFGLGEQRYAALVDLLIQLRQPQLSKRPNEVALSRALTEALPPVDQAVIADVAEAFRSLDEEKDELRAAAEAERAASAFLDHYRRYARVAARRRARLPRTEHARYEQFHRDLAQAQTDRGAGQVDRESAAELIAELEDTAVRLTAQDTALRAGPEMRGAVELERAAGEVARTAGALRQAEEDREEAAVRHTEILRRVSTAQGKLAAAVKEVEKYLTEGRAAAAAARMGPDGEPAVDNAPEHELRRTAEDVMARRCRTVEVVEALVQSAEEAARQHREATRRLDDADGEVTRAAERQAEAAEAVSAAGRTLLDRVREHLGACAELAVADAVGLLDRLQDWVGRLSGPYPVRAEATRAHRALSREFAARTASLAQRQRELAMRRTTLEGELAGLQAGGERGPGVPHTRTPGTRERMPGAPLWRLVDFRDEVPAAQRAGVEAALEASGLLDAWVLPDGVALDAAGHDVLLKPGPPLLGPSLANVLRPAVDHGDPQAARVDDPVVFRLLYAIGLGGGGDTWVAADGTFTVGALRGGWSKPTAEYLGEGAREEARRARIAVLRGELEGVSGEAESTRAELEALANRHSVLDAELAALPDDDELRQAHALAAMSSDTARSARERRERLAGELAEAARLAELSGAELAETASDLGLPSDGPGLAAVRQGLADYALFLASLWPALRVRDEAVRTLADARPEAERAARRVVKLAERAEEAVTRATAAEEHHSTLRDTVGAAVAELERRLTETARALRGCEERQRAAHEAFRAADRRMSHAEGRIERLQEDITEATAARATAIGALQRFAATGLLAVALPQAEAPDPHGAPWAATPAIALARGIEAALTGTDDSASAWERVQGHLSTEYGKLQDALSRNGHSASARMVEDGMVVDIVYQGRERAVPELSEALAEEVRELERILSAREREILETHLLTEVAGTLQELIGEAERRVLAMNTELERRPTSTGMKLRLVWRSSRKAPPGLGQARQRLRQSADAWSPEDRAAVGEFLQAQIAQRQSDDALGNWLEHLTVALDYRSWHEFGIERHQHGRWVPATGPASGGERVLAVSVPLFAAASSYYATAANPHAPRLVTLDEAFAGVDDDSRAKCLGLLHAFDLDVVMTSEREWACYPQVPGIAIAQLSRIDEVAAVLVTRWEWDGVGRSRGEEPDRGSAGVPGGERVARGTGPALDEEAGQESLWT